MNTYLKIKDLDLSYSNNLVLKKLNLEINKNEIICLLGESGSGKSSLSKVMMGLLPKTALIKNGLMNIQGLNIELNKKYKYWNKIRGQKIALIFQDASQSLNPVLTIYKHFEELMLFHKKCKKHEIKKIVINLLKKLNLRDTERILKSYPFELSGGMCQRISIALALSIQPTLIIADEPTSSIDNISRMDVLESFQNIKNVSILFITHDMSIAKKIADKIAIIYDGEVCEFDKKDTIFTNPKHFYTKQLLASYDNITKIKNAYTKNDNIVLKVEKLSKSYVKGKNIIDNLSFAVYSGETFGIIGESGCGKSTLARTLLNLEHNNTGKIYYNNQNIHGKKLAKDIQLIFQDSRASLNPRYNAIELVCEPLHYNKILDRKERIGLALQYLAYVGIDTETANRRPPQLSTGQCQRVAIARALIIKPKLLICDEAVSSLDINIQFSILSLLSQLKNKFHFTIIMISHDIHILKNFCNRIAVMKNGKFIEIRDGGKAFNLTTTPYTLKLIQSEL